MLQQIIWGSSENMQFVWLYVWSNVHGSASQVWAVGSVGIDIRVSARRDSTVASSRDQIQFDLFTGISSN